MNPDFSFSGCLPLEEIKKDHAVEKEGEINIDFSKIKQKVKNLFKTKEKSVVEHKKSGEDELSVDFSKVTSSFKKNAKWIIPLACILIAIIISVYLRTMPLRMSVTNDWAENTVYNYYRNGISNQIAQQYPNLPVANQAALVEKEWTKFLGENKDRISNDLAQVSEQYKSQFKDDSGTLYLLGIDPWYFYQKTKYVVENGFPGNEIKDGEPRDSYRLAPLGTTGGWEGWPFHYWFGALLHKLINLFSTIPLMSTFFLIGVIFSALAVIPAFFIGKRITGNNIGGFFTALLLAVSAFFVQRTTGESSDTDVYVVFFPLLIIWLFLEAFEAKEFKKKILWIFLAGISTALFSWAWSGWWYVFDFILGTIGIYLIYQLIQNHKTIKETVKSSSFIHSIYLGVAYFMTTWIITSLLFSPKLVFEGLIGPFGFTQLKAVAVSSLWPNIFTTVAELNVAPLSQVIEQIGGRLLFSLALVGIVLAFLRKDKERKRDIKSSTLLIIWFIASLYATTKGMRFILQATPVFAISFGAFLGITWYYISRWVSKELKIPKFTTQVIVFILLALLLIQPVKAGYYQAYNSVSSMNDGWYNTLNKINLEAPKDSIITSWWDFGYWFRAIANRPVTFDGGTQVGWGAHWVGRSLLTSNEEETAGILMMLNCGQNNAFDELDKLFNDTPREIEILHKILLQDKNGAIETLKREGLTPEQISGIIKYLHCEAPTGYYITSDDMVGKGGVWGHFGSWDFKNAEMWQAVNGLSRPQAIEILKNKYRLSENEADQAQLQIQNTPADQFVAPWPGYVTGLNTCQKDSPNEISCNVQTQQGNLILNINLENYDATIKSSNNEVISPASLIYADKENVKEKKFSGNTLPLSAVLVPQDVTGENYALLLADPLLAFSTFTKLYFFEGHGTKCFSLFDKAQPFTGGKIFTWKVDYECKQNNKVFFPKKEEVNAAHILISTQSRADEEALQLANEIKSNLTTANFAEMAQKYSEDPGSAAKSGDLGWFGKGVMIPEFEKVAFEQEKGKISNPVKSQFGYHIIYTKEKRTS